MKKFCAVLVWVHTTLDKEPKILLTKRLPACKTFVDYYAAPGGSVESEECIILAAQRELLEEAGLFCIQPSFKLLDCVEEETFKCFLFEVDLAYYRLDDLKNTEPQKHTDWELFSIKEALKLPKLMHNIRNVLLTKQKALSKIK